MTTTPPAEPSAPAAGSETPEYAVRWTTGTGKTYTTSVGCQTAARAQWEASFQRTNGRPDARVVVRAGKTWAEVSS